MLVPRVPSAAPPASMIWTRPPDTWLANSRTPAASCALCETISRLTIARPIPISDCKLQIANCVEQVTICNLQLLLDPIERPGDSLLPHLVLALAMRLVHLRLPGMVDLPVLAQIFQIAPEARRQTRRIRRAQRRGLGYLRADDRHAQYVALELHERVVEDHAAVDFEGLERHARDLLHR